MLNLLTLIAMIGLGVYLRVSWSYYVLLIVGAVSGSYAGMASFIRGSRFANGRGDMISVFCLLGCTCLALAIGWLHGWVLGILAAILFWPVMYRLGARHAVLVNRMDQPDAIVLQR